MGAERRIADSDLIRVPALIDLAHVYVRDYVGNWDVMIAAQTHFLQYGHLGAGMYRTVLNTLRTDPLQVALWSAVQALLPQPGPPGVATVTTLYPQPDRRPHRSVRPPPEEYHSFKVVVMGRCKIPYATTVSKAARPVLHRMRPGLVVQWWRHRLPDRELDYTRPCEVFNPQPRTECPARHSELRFWWEPPTLAQAWPDRGLPDEPIPDCRTCLRMLAEQEEESECDAPE